MYIVRYADDFKIFCRNYQDAKRIFAATKKWLKERLNLDISPEKSAITNLRKKSSEYLGFTMKATKRGKKYIVESRMIEKAYQRTYQRLKQQIKKIQNPRDTAEEIFELRLYNSMVVGIHNSFRFATRISDDCTRMNNGLRYVLRNRLRKRLSKKGDFHCSFIKERYGDSKQMRFVRGQPLIPIGYIQHRNPMFKKRSICMYTPEGREEIHRNLGVDMSIVRQLMRERHMNYSVEYMDNRISLYCAQHGKCAVTGKQLAFDEIHCHHKIPKAQGGNDKYVNLVIVHKDIHTLIHATSKGTVDKYRALFPLNKNMVKKINRLRAKLDIPTLAAA